MIVGVAWCGAVIGSVPGSFSPPRVRGGPKWFLRGAKSTSVIPRKPLGVVDWLLWNPNHLSILAITCLGCFISLLIPVVFKGWIEGPSEHQGLYICDLGCALILVSFVRSSFSAAELAGRQSEVALLLVEGQGQENHDSKGPEPTVTGQKIHVFLICLENDAAQRVSLSLAKMTFLTVQVHGKSQLDEEYDEEPTDRNLRLLESSAFSAFALELEEQEEPMWVWRDYPDSMQLHMYTYIYEYIPHAK